MIESILTSGAFTVVITLLTIVGLITTFNWLKSRIGKPDRSKVEEAIMPYVYKAIMAAYKTSEVAMDQLGERMKGADKEILADTVYHMLPDCLYIQGTKIPVKTFITEEQFKGMIKKAFMDFIGFYERNRSEFEEEMKKWEEENK